MTKENFRKLPRNCESATKTALVPRIRLQSRLANLIFRFTSELGLPITSTNQGTHSSQRVLSTTIFKPIPWILPTLMMPHLRAQYSPTSQIDEFQNTLLNNRIEGERNEIEEKQYRAEETRNLIELVGWPSGWVG